MRALLLALILAVLTSCGPRLETTTTKKVTAISSDQIRMIMARQDFECSSLKGGTCPEGIARLLILDQKRPKKSVVCSGFLVSENTLITNSHCIPDLTVCRNTYVAVYNGHSYEQMKCTSIVKVLNDRMRSNNPEKRLDVAIVKLDGKFLGKVFKLAKDSPASFQSVTAWVIDHTGLEKKDPNLFESRITQFRCFVTPDSYRKATMLGACPIIQGNSGSPVLNDDGEVVGVIWGGTSKSHSTMSLSERRESQGVAAITTVSDFRTFVK